MNQIKIKEEEIYRVKDLIPMHEIDLMKIIVTKQNWNFFLIKYNVNEKEKPLKIRLTNAHRIGLKKICKVTW